MTRITATPCINVNEHRARDVITPMAGLLASLPASLVETLETWQRRARERVHLQDLNEYFLRDMGITRADVQREISKPFWRA